MSKTKEQIEDTEQPETECVIFIPPKTELREKAIRAGSSNSAYKRAIQAAEDAIEVLSEEFSDWMDQEVDRLADALTTIRQTGWNEKAVDIVFTISHDLKGQASTLGYPVITEICNTLCHLLEKAPEPTRISLNVIETFIASIRTIIIQCDRNEDNTKANDISLGLKQMAMKILKHELNIAKAEKETALENA